MNFQWSFRCLLFAAAATAGAVVGVSAAPATAQPNILLMYVDNVGYGDLGCYGNRDVITPRIDRLAREGARCLDFQVVTTSCTPSRGALLTGRHPFRNGLSHQLSAAENRGGIGLPQGSVSSRNSCGRSATRRVVSESGTSVSPPAVGPRSADLTSSSASVRATSAITSTSTAGNTTCFAGPSRSGRMRTAPTFLRMRRLISSVAMRGAPGSSTCPSMPRTLSPMEMSRAA